MTEEVSKEQIKGENGTGIDEAKRLKEKKGANMVVKILAIVLVPLIAIGSHCHPGIEFRRGQNFRRDDEA